MQNISQASNYKSLNNKSDLISLIREYNNNKWTIKELKELSKKQLFCIYSKVNYKYVKNQG